MLGPVDALEGRVLRLRLDLGLCGLDQIEAWADRLIEKLDDPPYELIELSLARVNGYSRDALDSLAGTTTSGQEILLAFEHVTQESFDLQRICEVLSKAQTMAHELACERGGRGDPALDAINGGFDSYYLLDEYERGRLSEADIKREISGMLSEMRDAADTIGAKA
jgi:hypothetical protein